MRRARRAGWPLFSSLSATGIIGPAPSLARRTSERSPARVRLASQALILLFPLVVLPGPHGEQGAQKRGAEHRSSHAAAASLPSAPSPLGRSPPSKCGPSQCESVMSTSLAMALRSTLLSCGLARTPVLLAAGVARWAFDDRVGALTQVGQARRDGHRRQRLGAWRDHQRVIAAAARPSSARWARRGASRPTVRGRAALQEHCLLQEGASQLACS